MRRFSLFVFLVTLRSTIVDAAVCTPAESTTVQSILAVDANAKTCDLTTPFCEDKNCYKYANTILASLPDCEYLGVNYHAFVEATIQSCEDGSVDSSSTATTSSPGTSTSSNTKTTSPSHSTTTSATQTPGVKTTGKTPITVTAKPAAGAVGGQAASPAKAPAPASMRSVANAVHPSVVIAALVSAAAAWVI